MGKPTSHIDRPGTRVVNARRGYTLVEAMLASVLLSVTVVAVSGAISASYSHDQFAAQRRAALASGTQLLDEITALPLDATGTDPSVMKYATYTDEASMDELQSVVGTPTVSTSSSSEKRAKRTVSVVRKTSLSGANSATGDFAVVGVVVKSDDDDGDVTVKRLITLAEADAGK